MVENNRSQNSLELLLPDRPAGDSQQAGHVVVRKNAKYTTIIDSAVPDDRNIEVKELEKVDK